uniref:Uncharacterized protein n=1 Tax=viral metagenome TaxID=1070528 RepID=A0A6C0H818_9ZZZZ
MYVLLLESLGTSFMHNIINEDITIFININYLNNIFIDESSFCVNNYTRYSYLKKYKIINIYVKKQNIISYK